MCWCGLPWCLCWGCMLKVHAHVIVLHICVAENVWNLWIAHVQSCIVWASSASMYHACMKVIAHRCCLCAYPTDCRFSPISEEGSGQLGSEDGGGAGIKAAEATDWHSDGGRSSEDGGTAAAGLDPTQQQANGPTAAAGPSRGRLSAL